MDPQARVTFVAAYSRVLSHAWSSDEFTERLLDQPKQVLNENGLETPADAAVEIVRARDSDPDLATQIALWESGFATGRFVLYVPDMPQINTQDLWDSDLDSMAGGAGACCCCSPCSSCS
ncbi:hypothetical protein ABZX92_43250 [Lentzea sp. NPDC006480]|uniref:hypothetical protein n=1 Tax=Lentzea sp. NPDC006480 TaxID=3157176 RepID=UPI0033B9A8A5